MASILRIALALTAVLAVVVVVLWAVQERLVFRPPAPPPQQGRGATRIDYVSTDGQPLFGFWIAGEEARSEDGARPEDDAARSEAASHRVILHFHGNGDLADSWIDWAQDVARRTGWSVFLAEYRGYGGLPGRATYEGVMLDAHATLALLHERFGANPSDVVLYGHSLGTGVAAQLAAEQGARAVLLEGPITSVADAGRRSFPPPISFAISWISRIDFAPIDHVRKFQSPVWVACGDLDRVTGVSMSRSVFSAALHQGELLLVPGAGHGDVADRGGEAYWAWIRRALEG